MNRILLAFCALVMLQTDTRAQEADSFTAVGVQSGTTSTPEQCAATSDAFWVVVRGFFIMRTSHIHCKINDLLIWSMR